MKEKGEKQDGGNCKWDDKGKHWGTESFDGEISILISYTIQDKCLIMTTKLIQ